MGGYREQRFDRTKQIDWRRIREAKADLLATIQRDGGLDLKRVMADATLKGALAELEFSGHVRPAGSVTMDGNAAYVVAEDADQRLEFQALRKERDYRDYTEHARRGVAATDEQAEANRARVAEWRKRISGHNA